MTETKGRPLQDGVYLLPWTGGMAGETPRWADVLAMASRKSRVTLGMNEPAPVLASLDNTAR